jgi:FkbM family methyltransferase
MVVPHGAGPFAPTTGQSGCMNLFSTIARPCRRGLIVWARKPDRFLRHSRGVIHVGANSGQERDLYELFDLPVLWVEPIEEVFDQLQRNIANYPKQRALKALVTDRDGKEYEFHIASNSGQSSSIFDLKHHKDIWPEVTMEKTVVLQSQRLDSLLGEHAIDASDFDTLVMDTQGSELLVLKGAGDLLQNLKLIKTEAADFEAYEGSCRLEDLRNFLEPQGFAEVSRARIATHDQGGGYYDVVYRKAA